LILFRLIQYFFFFTKIDIQYNVLKTSTASIIHQPTNCISDNEPPECWDLKQIKYFCEEYPWIYFKNKKLGCKLCLKVNLNIEKKPESHVRVSSEWTQCTIAPSGDTIAKQQASLRKKISKHKGSQPHITAESIIERSKQETFELQVLKTTKLQFETTEKIFRTAYFIAKNQRPYVDMPKLVDLQVLNGISMGRVLQSDKSCATIIDHIANEMRIKMCKDIIENNRKLCIIVDESTTLSKKTMLVICLRCAIGDAFEVSTFFFDIVELNCTTAESIKTAILDNLFKYNINLGFLKNNLVGFVSDGASTMLGRKAGVGALLLNHFPDLIVWHCCNHRLELAVSDTLKEVNGVNHFQCFFEKLYSLYHQSPKNMRELKECAESLEQRILKIGKIFTIRWVASSYRTVRAVWNNFAVLHKHFLEASLDNTRDTKERSKYAGLNKMLTSNEFILNLGILLDALHELSDLSCQLQNRDLSLASAHTVIERTIRVIDSMVETPGPKLKEVNLVSQEMSFKGVKLIFHKSVQKINYSQFFRSLSNNLKSRLFTTQSSNSSNNASSKFQEEYDQLLSDLDIFVPKNWPDNFNIQYSDDCIRRLSKKFKVDEITSVRGFRQFKDTKEDNVEDLKLLTTAIKCIAISSSECERSFSSMNEIVSPKRNSLGSVHISSLVFINCVGPPIDKINPTKWIESWVKKGKRTAEEENCPKRIKITEENVYKSLWNLIKE